MAAEVLVCTSRFDMAPQNWHTFRQRDAGSAGADFHGKWDQAARKGYRHGSFAGYLVSQVQGKPAAGRRAGTGRDVLIKGERG
jgi:hypothetical protein